MKAVVSVLQIYLGDEWNVDMAPTPSGSGRGTETAILAFRKKGKGFDISAEWVGYTDLGDKRDMAVFKLKLSRGSEKKDIPVGSVHLTPDDPDRGEQMIKVAEWMVSKKDVRAISMGDFNWGITRNLVLKTTKAKRKLRSSRKMESCSSYSVLCHI